MKNENNTDTGSMERSKMLMEKIELLNLRDEIPALTQKQIVDRISLYLKYLNKENSLKTIINKLNLEL